MLTSVPLKSKKPSLGKRTFRSIFRKLVNAMLKICDLQKVRNPRFIFSFGCVVVTSVPVKSYLDTLSKRTVQPSYEHMEKKFFCKF